MNADAEGHPQPRRPAPGRRRRAAASRASGAKTAEHHDAAPREVAAVAGADQHAVEHEHHAGHRLEHRRHQQHRPSRSRTAGSSVNSGPSTGADGREQRRPVTTPDDQPHCDHPVGDRAGAVEVAGAQRSGR